MALDVYIPFHFISSHGPLCADKWRNQLRKIECILITRDMIMYLVLTQFLLESLNKYIFSLYNHILNTHYNDYLVLYYLAFKHLS